MAHNSLPVAIANDQIKILQAIATIHP